MNKFFNQNTRGGYVIILNTLIFLAITFFVAAAIVSPLISSNQATRAFTHSARAYMAGNSAVEEVLYRLKNGYELSSTETVALGTATATVAVASETDSKNVTVSSADGGYIRDINLQVSRGAGVSFNYGLQAGLGGFEMSGGARINGNVYSNGDIIGSGGPIITGGAIVANRSNPSANQSNGSTFPPPYNLDFGGNSTPQDLAQSFTVSTSTAVTSLSLYLKRTTTGWMNDVSLYITADNGGKPHKTKLASANISTSQVTTAYNYISIPLSSPLTLTPGTTYWIVLDTSTTWGAYYSLGASSNTYAGGLGKTGSWSNGNGGSWNNTSPSGLDGYFDIYVGGDTGNIDGISSIGQSGGDAWAHTVSDSSVYGNLYCQGGSGNNKACDTSRPDPAEQPFPISDGNIDDWKAEAEAGGVTVGDVSTPSYGEQHIGPQKIVGNLSVGGSAVLVVDGTLYVTGNIAVSGGGKIKLASSFGSNPGVVVTDGRIDLTGGGTAEGNGQSDSYILMLTTSECPMGSCGGHSAIEVSGGTSSVVLNAQKGTIAFTGGAVANQATAYKIVMSGGTTVNYLSGLADVNFTSGPSGSWTIDEWADN